MADWLHSPVTCRLWSVWRRSGRVTGAVFRDGVRVEWTNYEETPLERVIRTMARMRNPTKGKTRSGARGLDVKDNLSGASVLSDIDVSVDGDGARQRSGHP